MVSFEPSPLRVMVSSAMLMEPAERSMSTVARSSLTLSLFEVVGEDGASCEVG